MTAVAVTGDGRAVTGSEDGTVMVWDMNSGQPLHTLATVLGHTGSVNAVAVMGDGRAVTASDEGTLIVWDLDSGEALLTLRSDAGLTAVAVTSDGQAIVTGSAGTVEVWDLDTGQEPHNLTGHQNWDTVNAVAVTGDGRAVTGSDDRTAIVWDLERGQALHTLTGHHGEVTAVAVISDGRIFTFGDHEEMSIIWNLDSGEIVGGFGDQGQLQLLTVTADDLAVAPALTGRLSRGI